MKFLEHEAEYRRAMAAMQSGQFSRREVLRKMGAGFGTLGLAGLLQQSGLAGTVAKLQFLCAVVTRTTLLSSLMGSKQPIRYHREERLTSAL